MKRTLLIFATVALGFTTLNATTATSILTNATSLEITKDNIIEVYDWKVITKNGKSEGTSLNLEEAKRMIALFSAGDIIIENQITSYNVLRSEAKDTTKRLYFWKVESNYGQSEGFAYSQAAAERLIALAAKGDIITYKVIASKDY
ncbi:hypothetical protein [Winogradskyella psychrotolerans]|uniref:hypothetical protein n=1 Tax=Winogradskyella psychrotolerans TaxID=1344585 RepID=UPI001C07B5DE|nr:hypothetical protein [Winogradskyella psychrotolerans]MBU2927899.1 hypothetical protein [Winogradskyella psychrotolerans]